MKIKKISLALSCLICASSAFSDMSPWLIRVRGIDVMPQASSSAISAIGGHVNDVSNSATGELDFSYFFTEKLAAELILATTRHNVWAHGTALGNVNLGKVSVLPPTLTAQFHFSPHHMINPYAGVGINVTHFYHIDSGPVATGLHYANTVGPAVQLGTDIAINEHFLLNFDAKKIYIKPNVDVYTPLGTLHSHVAINPWVIGGGAGYRF